MDSSSTSIHSSGMNADSSTHKRKLSASAEDRANGAPPPPASANAGSGGIGQINYLTKQNPDRLKLIMGDSDTFRDVLDTIDAYEAVLNRHESIAANLGAKLVAPLLLKGLEKLFEGPITIVDTSYAIQNSPVTWLEIVLFARGNPSSFVLSEHQPGTRSCRIHIKGGQVEIGEDDYRLITSGAPEKMIPTTALPDDEATELSTLNILEQRLAMLIKKADAVASKARQLNYHLKGRKSAISSNKTIEQPSGTDSNAQAFPPVNTGSSQPPATDSSRRQAQLVEHYTKLDRSSSVPQNRPKTAVNGHDAEPRRSSQTPSASSDHNRAIMSRKIEKLSTGDLIDPPCDRCRRIGQDCVKNMTACQGCTKKHAKCIWNNVQEGELEGGQATMALKQDPAPGLQQPASTENSTNYNGGHYSGGNSRGGIVQGGQFNGGGFADSPNPFARGTVQVRGLEGHDSPRSSPDLFADGPIGRGRGRAGASVQSSPDLFADSPIGQGRGGYGSHQSPLSVPGTARPADPVKTTQDDKILAKIATATAAAGPNNL